MVEGAHDGVYIGRLEGLGDYGTENEAAVGCIDGDDFESCPGTDLDVDVAGGSSLTAGGEGEAAGEEVEAAVIAFIENHRAFAV